MVKVFYTILTFCSESDKYEELENEIDVIHKKMHEYVDKCDFGGWLPVNLLSTKSDDVINMGKLITGLSNGLYMNMLRLIFGGMLDGSREAEKDFKTSQ